MPKPKPWITPDEVVGANIRRLRNLREPRWSQQKLADELQSVTGERGWKDRIVRMEGTEFGSTGQKRRSASWAELVSLALALESTIYDLVLPPDDSVEVIVAKTTAVDESHVVGQGLGDTHMYVHPSSRDELAKILFAMPAASLTRSNLEEVSRLYPLDIAEAMHDIRDMHGALTRAITAFAAQNPIDEAD